MSPSAPLEVNLAFEDRISSGLAHLIEMLDTLTFAAYRLRFEQRLEDRRWERELVRMASLLRSSRLERLKCHLFGHPGFAAKVTYLYTPKTGRRDPVDVTSFGDTHHSYLIMSPREGWHRIVGRRRCGACGARA